MSALGEPGANWKDALRYWMVDTLVTVLPGPPPLRPRLPRKPDWSGHRGRQKRG